jgi:hypothetical protein
VDKTTDVEVKEISTASHTAMYMSNIAMSVPLEIRASIAGYTSLGAVNDVYDWSHGEGALKILVEC